MDSSRFRHHLGQWTKYGEHCSKINFCKLSEIRMRKFDTTSVYVASKFMCKTQIRKRHKRSSEKSNYELVNQANNKHLITGLKGNCEFCFPKITKLTFSCGVIECFVIPPNSTKEKESGKRYLLDACRYNKFVNWQTTTLTGTLLSA